MRLKNPGSIDAAIEMLGQRVLEVGNIQSLNSMRAKDDCLRWLEDTDTHLRNHFADSSLADEFSRSYWHVHNLDPNGSRPYPFLDREKKLWEKTLTAAVTKLEAFKPFIDRPGQPVVLDTSALIEGQYFMDVDWRSLHELMAKGPVRLILPIIVVDELDDLKRDRRCRDRARSVLHKLWDLHSPDPGKPTELPGRKDVTIEVLLDDDWHERRPVNDAEIIDQAVYVRELLARDVVLVAGDYTMLYQAAAAKLTAVLMPEPVASRPANGSDPNQVPGAAPRDALPPSEESTDAG